MSFQGNIKLRTLIHDIYVTPANDRLVMYPAKNDTELFKRIDKVSEALYDKLPYTPITAIGHNFAYKLDERESYSISVFEDMLEYEGLYKKLDLELGNELNVKHSLLTKDDNYVVLNLTFKQVGIDKMLEMNYHYQVNQEPEKINHAINKCYSNYEHSQIIRDTFIL